MTEAAAKAAERIKEIQEQAMKRRTQTTTKTAAQVDEQAKTAANEQQFAKIQENAFFKIMMGNATPKQQLAEATGLLIATKDKKADKERMAEFAHFQEWVLYQDKEVAQEIIRMLDTTTEAELQQAYNEIAQGANDYEDRVRPFMENLNAFFDLHVKGKTHEALREIKEEEEARELRAKERAEQEAKLKELEAVINSKKEEITVLEQDRSFFGMGGIKKAALDQIAVKNTEIDTATKEIEILAAAIAKSSTEQVSESALGEDLIEAKERLRHFLNLSSDEHVKLKTELLQTTNAYINDMETRVGTVLKKMKTGSVQTDQALDATMKLRGMFAIMSDAIGVAKKENSKIRAELQIPSQEESEMDKLLREEGLIAVEDHIATIDLAGNSTLGRLGELSAQTLSLKGRKDNKTQQIQKTLDIKTAGIAAMANNVALTLDALTNTSLSQAAGVVESSIERMNKGANEIVSQNAIRGSLVMAEENDRISTTVAEFAKLGAEFRKATEQQSQLLTARHSLEEDLLAQSEELKKTLQAAIAMRADVIDSSAENNVRNSGAKIEENKNAKSGAPSIFNFK